MQTYSSYVELLVKFYRVSKSQGVFYKTAKFIVFYFNYRTMVRIGDYSQPSDQVPTDDLHQKILVRFS